MGKSLISDAQMLAIHETMLHLRALEQEVHDPFANAASRAAGRIPPRPISLLAATLLQLYPTDTVFTDGEDALAAEVLALAQAATFAPGHQASLFEAGNNTAALAAGHSLAQSRMTRPADDAPITVALLRDTPADLDDLFHLAGTSILPLLLIVQSGDVTRSTSLESRTNVEVVRIDADDAVACCRVMQESLLRTRNRWGAVILQAVTLPGAVDPIAAFETHLRRRNLAFEQHTSPQPDALTR